MFKILPSISTSVNPKLTEILSDYVKADCEEGRRKQDIPQNIIQY